MGESIHPIVHPEKKEDQESAGLPAADIEEALDTAIETVKRKKSNGKHFSLMKNARSKSQSQ